MAVQVVSSATFISAMLSIVTLPVLLWKLHPLSSWERGCFIIYAVY
ncbi:hypothetical protein M3585_20115 [Bacillus subtilis]|nr:hypothetical protein [Bacillus subtilis]